MPSKIPAIGASNWGTELNTIFTDVTTSSDLSKPIPGTAYAGGGRAMIDPRAIAAADLTLYVSPSGTDPVAGVAVDFDMGLSLAKSFKTIKAVVEYACKFQHQSYKITIKISDGTYAMTTPVTINSSNYISIEGNTALPQNVKLETDKTGFIIETPATILGMSFRCTQFFTSTNVISFTAIFNYSTAVIQDCNIENYKYGISSKGEMSIENTINVKSCFVSVWSAFGGIIFMDCNFTSTLGKSNNFYAQGGKFYFYSGTYNITDQGPSACCFGVDDGLIDIRGFQLFTRRGLLTNSTISNAAITINSQCFYYIYANYASQFFADPSVKHIVTCETFITATFQSLVSMFGVNPASSFNIKPNGILAQCYYNSYALVPAQGSMPNVATNTITVVGNSGVDKQGRAAVLNPSPSSGGFIVG